MILLELIFNNSSFIFNEFKIKSDIVEKFINKIFLYLLMIFKYIFYWGDMIKVYNVIDYFFIF